MCFVNYEKRLIYYHIPKCGGNTVFQTICNYYGFNEITKNIHQNYETFFLEKDKHFIDNIRDKHTIREKGKLRYYYSHQDIDPVVLDEYFSFTFVRNPYTKLFSAYCYLNRHISTDLENPTIRGSKDDENYYRDFNTFVKNYSKVNNIAFYHAFITQYEQLLSPNGSIQISYIGRTENLDDDFCRILTINGIDIHSKHSSQIFDEEKKNATRMEKDKRIQDFYNEDTFCFVNSFFEKDFDTFGYKRFNSFEEFKNSDLNEIPKSEINKNCQILKTYLKINEDYVDKINPIIDDIIDLLSNNQQNSQLILFKQQIDFLFEKKRKQELKYNLEDKIKAIEKETVFKSPFKICEKCNRRLWNELSYQSHNFTCQI